VTAKSKSSDGVQKQEVTAAIREYEEARTSRSMGLRSEKHEIQALGYVAE